MKAREEHVVRLIDDETIDQQEAAEFRAVAFDATATREQEAAQTLDVKIDKYAAIYEAVAKKVASEHVQAVIVAAIIAER